MRSKVATAPGHLTELRQVEHLATSGVSSKYMGRLKNRVRQYNFLCTPHVDQDMRIIDRSFQKGPLYGV